MKKILTKILKYAGFYGPAKDVKTRIEEHMRLRRALKFYSSFIRKGDLCFDIGANVGDKTGLFLRLGASVVVVEPRLGCVEKLRERYGDNPLVRIIPKAAGGSKGTADIFITDSDILSSLSPGWIEKVKASGRFSGREWSPAGKVEVVTLDGLIKEFGKPVFCKIDVEGYEYEVLKGLSRPLRYLCFEFTPERKKEALKCVEYLSGLGKPEFNYSEAESLRFSLPRWVGPERMRNIICSVPVKDGPEFWWGDVYVRMLACAADKK